MPEREREREREREYAKYADYVVYGCLSIYAGASMLLPENAVRTSV